MIRHNIVKECFECHGKGHTMTKRIIKQFNDYVNLKVNDIIRKKNRDVSFAERMRIKKRVEKEVYKMYIDRYACKLCNGTGKLVYPL